MKDYLSRFAYPGQNPDIPVINLAFYNVGDPWTDIHAPFNLGRIQTIISNNGLTVSNITQRGHVFFDGRADRTVYNENGDWFITTRSYGNNAPINIVSPGPPPGLNEPNTIVFSTSSINNFFGPFIFNEVDQKMLEYILINR